jgi:hypothetical protein
VDQDETFQVTDDHLKLLRAAQVSWDDSMYEGAPEIDIKRPYGNKYDVAADVAFILTGEQRELSAHERARYIQLHRDMERVLAIVLATGSFAPGRYVKRPFRKWAKASPGRAAKPSV